MKEDNMQNYDTTGYNEFGVQSSTVTDSDSRKIIINDQVYDFDSLSVESRRYVEHMLDIENRMNKCVFDMEQLSMTRDFLSKLLDSSLSTGVSATEKSATEQSATEQSATEQEV